MSYKEAIAAGIVVAAAIFAGESRGAPPPQPPAKEASIPFVNSGSIRDWRAIGTRDLYIQDVHGQWYHAKLMSSCTDLPYAETIGFKTQGLDTLDHFGTLIVRGRPCPIQSMVKSGAPPAKAKRAKQNADKPGRSGY